MSPVRIRFALTALVALTTACTGAAAPGTAPAETLPAGSAPEPTVVRTAGSLVEFDACDQFLDYVVSHAIELVGPYGLQGGPTFWPEMAMRFVEEAASDGGGDAPAFSGTNVQVEGVDEPDIVKTDGQRIVLISEGELIVVDVTGEEPTEVGRLHMGDISVQNLFLSGDRVLLFGSVWTQGPVPLDDASDRFVPPGYSTPTVRIAEVDLSDDPEIVRTMTIDGSFVSGRMVGDSVRLVLTSGPVGLEWSYPEGSGLRAEREAVEKNKEIVRRSTEENWIPYYIVTDADGNVTDEGLLLSCDRAAHPEEFSGLDMLSVVTVDLGAGLDVVDGTGLMATGDTVYASEDSLYVATHDWQTWVWFETREESDRPEGPTTEIHKFDIGDDGRTRYLATGSVDGYLLNQFAMDEHEGMLRVASTTSPSWWGGGSDSESRITVLREIGAGLVPIGMVDGLGEGERIYSVRFMGDIGYVVTFRQVDPLYTVDLSDPRDPEVLGELKIPGYSSYLHPVGDDRVLGVGQDATEDGVVEGTQVSLFDVSDPSHPRRLDTHTLGDGTNSEVEYDHHAFLYWDGLAVVPVQQWTWDGKTERGFVGALALRVGDDGTLTEVGKLTHPGGEGQSWDWSARILRSVAIGDSLYTISQEGVMKSSLENLDEEAWLDF